MWSTATQGSKAHKGYPLPDSLCADVMLHWRLPKVSYGAIALRKKYIWGMLYIIMWKSPNRPSCPALRLNRHSGQLFQTHFPSGRQHVAFSDCPVPRPVAKQQLVHSSLINCWHCDGQDCREGVGGGFDLGAMFCFFFEGSTMWLQKTESKNTIF